MRRLQYTGYNCVEVLAFVGSPGVDCDMVHTTDRPIVYANKGGVAMRSGEWVVVDDAGVMHVIESENDSCLTQESARR